MVQTSRTFRIFVSSTFSDLKEERNALQKKVFPRLRELCMQHGCRFQAIDLRWGVREEATLDQQTMKICYEEIARCQRVTPRPNFIVLLGDRYGWRPLPFEIPADEFMEIEQHVSDTDKELLKKWYRRDDNAVPPVYCLQPRTGEFADYAKWEVVERRLHSILLHAAAGMKLTADSYVKYTASATEQEIVQGLKAPDAGEHVFGFFRSIKDLPHNSGAKDFIDLDETGNLDRNANKYLNDLKDRLQRLLPGNIYKYKAEWTGSELTAEHIDRLCSDVYDSLSIIILKEIAKLVESDPLDKEIADHIASGKDRAKFFIGRTDILKTISEYVKGTYPHPLAVSGASGSGKSALMAHAAEKVRNEHKNAEVVVRFIGATPNSSDVRTLLESLCRQISRCYGADESTVPADYKDLIKDMPKRLAIATAEKPLFLFLDALDQLSNADNARNLIWLPAELPAHVHLVVSTLPGECLSALEKKLPGANFAELEPMSLEEGAKLLDMWLDDAHRKLQEDQRIEILRKFGLCGMPLYLRLAFGEAQRWKSYDGLPLGSKGHGLSEDIPGIIRDMFWRLSQESNHGRMLVERSLGYLAVSRNGLTEDEMLDVLSQDGELYQDFLKRTYHKPPEQRLPVVVWSRLFFDLEPYLTWRSADGTSLLAFFHRQLGEVVMEDFLKGEEKKERHRALARYFGEQPYWAERDKIKTLNLRKTAELPYQQAWSGLGDELIGTLTDFNFMEAKVLASGTNPLIEDYELAFISGIKVSEERTKHIEKSLRLIQGALRLSAHVLAQDKAQLPGQLVGRLITHEATEIRALIGQIKNWNGAPWLRPLIACLVPAGGPLMNTLEGHTDVVNAVAVTPNGRNIISASSDKTLKVWDIETGEQVRTLKGHTAEVIAVAATPNGRNIISASRDKTLKVWDIETGEQVRTLEGHTGVVNAVAVTPNGRNIISASSDKTLKVWDIETGEQVRTLEGHTTEVNAVAVTALGKYVISASRHHTLKIWDMETGKILRTLKSNKDNLFNWDDIPGNDTWKLIKNLYDLGYHWVRTAKIEKIDNGKTIIVYTEGNSISLKLNDERTIVNIELGYGVSKEFIAKRENGKLNIFPTVEINAFAVIPDGRRIITASGGGTLKIWDIETGDGLSTIEHYTPMYEAMIAITPDSRRMVLATWAQLSDQRASDRLLKIWDIETSEKLCTFEGHSDGITAVAVTPDGKRVISASSDRTLKIWNIEIDEKLHVVKGHNDRVTSVAVTPNGRYMISVSKDKTMKLWNMETCEIMQTLHDQDIQKIWDSQQKMWNMDPMKMMIDSLHAPTDSVENPYFMGIISGIFLFSWDEIPGNDDESLIRFLKWRFDIDLEKPTKIEKTDDGKAIRVTTKTILLSLILNDEKTKVNLKVNNVSVSELAAKNENDELNIYSGIKTDVLHALYTDKIRAIAVTPNGQGVISASWDDTPIVEDMSNFNKYFRLGVGHADWIGAVVVTPDGRCIISASWGDTLQILDMETGKILHTLQDHTDLDVVGDDVDALHPLMRKISGSWDDTLIIWDIKTGRILRILQGNTNWVGRVAAMPPLFNWMQVLPKFKDKVSAVAVTPDSQRIISGLSNRTLRIWDIKTGEQLDTLEGHTDVVTAVAVTPDGKRVISASKDKTLKIWDIETGEELYTLEGHRDKINGVAATPNGRCIISVSNDKTLKVWDIEIGKFIAGFSGDSPLWTCAISPNGSSVVAGDEFGQVHFLRLENVVLGTPIITARYSQEYAFPCPLCHTWSEIPASSLGKEIPCPRCGKPVKLNPFTINADWRPVAKAWRGGKD